MQRSQENRAFDHYYGMLAGLRGFNDRTSMILPSGRNSFYQPINVSNDDYMLPFPVHSLTTNAVCMNSPEMDFPADTGIHNEGRCDAWNTARAAGMGMAHWEREDLPYYYALYDNFLVGDQYFQSTLTQTNPNRLHFFSGSNGLSVGQKAILDNGGTLVCCCYFFAAIVMF
jgi:phospholipase C